MPYEPISVSDGSGKSIVVPGPVVYFPVGVKPMNLFAIKIVITTAIRMIIIEIDRAFFLDGVISKSRWIY